MRFFYPVVFSAQTTLRQLLNAKIFPAPWSVSVPWFVPSQTGLCWVLVTTKLQGSASVCEDTDRGKGTEVRIISRTGEISGIKQGSQNELLPIGLDLS